MKNGMDIMEEDFPDMGSSNTIRVMAEGLDEAQKTELSEKLKAIPNVESVKHDDSEDYNKDDYSLYVISTEYAYNSPEESAIEDALAEDFGEYNIVFQNDNTGANGIPTWILIVAMVILLTILFVMCESWLEPILFLVAIGFAVIINAGTNIILGEISSITSSISAILQLVLSMDYSIILLNRYRQEKALGISNNEAMASALHHSFTSVSSSAMTTVVGLLALVFMNFKIGVDLGVVLAKGVFISLVCVLTVLPSLILLFDKQIAKTAKKYPHISMGAVARFSYKFRHVLLGVFVVLFIGTYLLQGNTQTVYTLTKKDPIADVFPSENMLVLVYNNDDEDKVADLADSLEEKDGVKQVLGYPNLLGKSYTSEEFTDTINSLGNSMGIEIGDDIDLDPALLELIYYHYYDGSTSPLTMEEFLTFLSDDVLNNDTFADAIDKDMREQADRLADFSNAANLTSTKSIAELAEFFDMDEETIKNLLLFYYTQYGGVDSGTMTLPTFASFVVDEIATDPDYSSMFDADTLSKIKQLKTFTNTYNITTPFSYTQIANMLGIDADMVELLFVYYYAQSDGYEPGTMTLPSFVNFLQTDVMKNPTFSSYLDESTKAQISTLSKFTDKAALQKQHTSAELAQMLSMDESMVRLLFTLHNAQDVSGKTLTLAQFISFLNDNIMNNPMFADSFGDETKAQLQTMKGLIQTATSGQALAPAQMAQILGMDEATLCQLYFLYFSTDVEFQQEVANMTMTMSEFMALLEAQTPADSQTQLVQMEQMVKRAASNKGLDTATLAQIFGMDENLITMIFRLYYGADITDKTMSMGEMVNFILADPVMSGFVDNETMAQLKTMQGLINATLDDTAFTYSKLASTLGMDSSMLKMLFTYHDTVTGRADTWNLSLQTVVNFILNNKETFSSMMDSGTISQLSMMQRLMEGTVKGSSYTPSELADLVGMDSSQLEQLYLLNISRYGDTSSWQMSIQQLINFLNSDVLTNEDFADLLDEDSKEMLTGAKIMIDAVISGKKYTAAETQSILNALTDDLDASTIELLYFYHSAENNYNSAWALSVDQLFNHLHDSVLNDARFSTFIDDEMKSSIEDMSDTLNDGIEMMKTEEYSRMIIYTTLPIESSETTAFMDELTAVCDSFENDYYLVGNTAMSYEMQQTFDKEMLFITLLTALAIFLIVLISFRSFVIPVLLVLIVQCGVYTTVSILGLQGYSIYFLALLIVECILMGATIDYGILFTNYYRDNRKNLSVLDSLKAAYNGSIHTIMTSGLIIVLVTGIVGYTHSDPTIAQICRTIATGALSAILLILFVLPGLLALFDKFIVRKKKSAE